MIQSKSQKPSQSWKRNKKFIWKLKQYQIAKATMKNKSKAKATTIQDIKNILQGSDQNSLIPLLKHRRKMNRMESPDVSSHMHRQLICDKRIENKPRGKGWSLQQMLL